MTRRARILIAGAGVGGLAAALCLHRKGFRNILVIEAVEGTEQPGVGLNVLPNAIRVLDGLGLLEPLSRRAVHTSELRYYNCRGDLVWREPRGIAAGHRWPQLSVHRSDLHAALRGAVRARLGEQAVVTGVEVTHVDADERRAVVMARSTAGTRITFSGDVVVGADGIESAVRAALHPDEGAPAGNGMVMWRGTSWVAPFLDGRTMVVSGDDRRRIVLYPVRQADDGDVLVNWVCAQPALEGEEPPSGHRVTLARLHASFDVWRMRWLDVPSIIAAAEEVYEFPMLDREPLPSWTSGVVTLLGDAAHAMYPMGSNGATQAIVDAHVLAESLARYDRVTDALHAYESERRPVTTGLQVSNRTMGPESVITIAHQRAPGGFTDVNEVFAPGELAAISDRYSRLGRFDAESVNRIDVERET